MKKYYASQLDDEALGRLCERRTIAQVSAVFSGVRQIVATVRAKGDRAVTSYNRQFGGYAGSSLKVTQAEIEDACERVAPELKEALAVAAANIRRFYGVQKGERVMVETMPGVVCFAESRPIERVGLYIPGGTAPLVSTVLMLAIPARLAGCKDLVLCTPPDADGGIPDAILYAAKYCDVATICKAGGAQAIAAMAFGTESIPKVDKIFGPGNQYVTAAKQLVSIDPTGAAIDMPSGPTEMLVIADGSARADFVASDLLSQAEHGVDSQVVLVCTSDLKADEILDEVQRQARTLPRRQIARSALKNSFALVVQDVRQAIAFANRYAPEHLILNVTNYRALVPLIMNAGSVFLGQYACESAGDYASGTNHCLPTYGYARAYSGVSVASFQKRITFQEVTKQGARRLAPSVCLLAETEELAGHKQAMTLRVSD